MNILIIRFRQMGDALLATVTANTLRKTFPQARIDMVLNHRIAPLFEGHPAFDNIITFTDEERKKPLTYLHKVWQVVHKCRYDVLIDLRTTVNTLPFALFSRHSRFRIGLEKGYTRGIFTHRIAPCAPTESMISHNLAMVSPLNAIAPVVPVNRFTLNIAEHEKQEMKAVMLAAGIDFAKPVVLVGVTAKLADKTWRPDYMVELLQRFMQKHPQAQLVFNFAPGKEQQNAMEIYEALGRDARIFMNVEAKTMRQLAAMAAHIDFYFGNEGGARHVVHAMGKPSFVVCCPKTHKEMWIPKNDIPAEAVAPADVLNNEQLSKMSYNQRYDAMTPQEVWKRLEPFAQLFVR